jgi:hypothetical protein
MEKIDDICHVMHGFIAGFTTGMLEWFGLAVAIFMFIQFTLYETVEEKRIQDELYKELKEWSLGYVAGFTIGATLKHLSNL